MKPWIIAVVSVVIAALAWALLVGQQAPPPPPREPEVVQTEPNGAKKVPHASIRPTKQLREIDRSKLQKIEIPPEAFEKAKAEREAKQPSAPATKAPAAEAPPK